MATTKKKYRYRFLSFLFFLIPLLLFVLLLSVKIPISFSQIFRNPSIFLFVIIFGIFVFSFRLQGNYSWLLGLCITAVVFAIPLSFLWTSGFSDSKIIGGLLPHKDGFYYYNGANGFLNGLMLTFHAAWRPQFTGFLSVLLLFSNNNLQLTLAFLAGLTGLCCYLSARKVYEIFNAPAAAAYMTLICFYIVSWLGYTATEILGLAIGCLGLIFMIRAAQTLKTRDLIFGLSIMMIAIIVRPGAFFVFPLFILWAGWVFRGKKPFSFRIAFTAFMTVIICYLLFASVFSFIISKNAGLSTSGNFTYTLYGQVMGGTGWKRGAQALGQSADSSTMYKIIFQEFLDHPISLFIATAKAYRDFFIPNRFGIFSPFSNLTNFWWMNYIFWWAGIGSLFWGLYKAWQNIKSPINSLMIASFIGIFLSIPFLPPMDGGSRFYSATMPFFFLLMASIIQTSPARKQNSFAVENNHIFKFVVNSLSTALVVMTFLFPVLIQKFSKTDTIPSIICPKEEIPFAVKLNPGSFIDLIPNETSSCGFLPDLCLNDFEAYGKEKKVDEFYQDLLNTAKLYGSRSRIFTGNNLLDNKQKFFIMNLDQINITAPGLITGCAVQGQHRLLLLVQSTVTEGTSTTSP